MPLLRFQFKELIKQERNKSWYKNLLENFINPYRKTVKEFAIELWSDKTNTNILFSVIWIITAVFFFIQAWQTYRQVSITLPRFTSQLPQGVAISGVDIGKTVNDFAETHNISVDSLEQSIRSSASFSFALNTMSGMLAVFGLCVQMRQYLQEKTNNDEKKREKEHHYGPKE
jgi:uncharacterized integral membrane protein